MSSGNKPLPNQWTLSSVKIFVAMCPLWASYQIRKIAGCACAGNAGNVFLTRRLESKPLVSDTAMHHGTCVMHVPWCMSASLTCGGGENVPVIPGACAPAILRIWQEAHEAIAPHSRLRYILSKRLYSYFLLSLAGDVWSLSRGRQGAMTVPAARHQNITPICMNSALSRRQRFSVRPVKYANIFRGLCRCGFISNH